MSSIYEPAEDSLLLAQFVEDEIGKSEFRNLRILDMGSGSGIQSQKAIQGGVAEENITIVDINYEAINMLMKKFPKSKIILSDLFQNVTGKFDLIIFNPPYLPEDEHDSEADTTGGKEGGEVINKFLKKAKGHLTNDGKILLLTSSLTKSINWQNYNKKLLGKRKLFFEELFIWTLTK